MLWIKSLHLVFMAVGFAGLSYLPRLFVYRARATDVVGVERKPYVVINEFPRCRR